MAVLGSIFAGSWAAMGGGEKPKTAAGPPINASSKEEGDFIQYVISAFLPLRFPENNGWISSSLEKLAESPQSC